MPNNPPAFPHTIRECGPAGVPTWDKDIPGMTLRDYFAAAALVALSKDAILLRGETSIARHAYRIADAMLLEREKGQNHA